MLVIRLQRSGRKGHAMFRVVVQDSRQTPTSGKVVAWLGSYDPHSKLFNVNKEKAGFYLDHGAQPSERIARLLQTEGVKLPKWVNIAAQKQRDVRNAEKRRSTKSPEEKEPEAATETPETESTEAVQSQPTVVEETKDVSEKPESSEEPEEKIDKPKKDEEKEPEAAKEDKPKAAEEE
jgi:small subunit ribosomal protein S16